MSKGKNYPPFSVLMSVYKNEKPNYLDLALKSVINQTVKPSEIILVEDGPIPNSLKIVIDKHKKYFGNGFRVIVSPENRGLGAALKLGTEYVSTNWIARMDTDDYSVPNRFERQLDAIEKQPDLAVVGGQVKEFASSINNIVGQRKVPVDNDTIHEFIKWRSPFNHPTVMINKNVLQKIGGGYIPYGNLEDYYLWSRIIANNYAVMNIPEFIVYMRVDKGMYSRRGKLSNIKYFFGLRKYLRKKGIINVSNELLGDIMMTLNILLPGKLRKKIYQNFLHK